MVATKSGRPGGGSRWNKSMLLAGLTLLSSLGAAGFVIASQSPSDGVPNQIETVAPRHGDRGSYMVEIPSVLAWPSGTDDWNPTSYRLNGIAFEEQGQVATLDVEGRARMAERVLETRRWYDLEEPEKEYAREWTHDLARGGGAALIRTQHSLRVPAAALTEIVLPTAPPVQPPVDPGLGNETTVGEQEVLYERRDLGAFAASNTLFCGHRHSLQGQRIDRSVTLVAFGACDANAPAGPNTGTRFQLDGVSRARGADALQYSSVQDSGKTKLWMHPDLPVPLRIEMRVDAANVSKVDAPHVVFHLERFNHGDRPIDARPDPDTPALPVGLVPAGRWGPDPGAIVVPWALEDAFAAARDSADNSDVRDFMQQHPAGRVVEAQNHFGVDESQTPNRRIDGWRFIVADEGAGLEVIIRRGIARAQAPLGPAIEAPTEASHEYTMSARRINGPFPEAARLPAFLPAPTDIYARAVALNRSIAGSDDVTYGFAVLCGDSACNSVVAYSQAGRDYTTWPNNPITISATSGDTRNANLLAVDQQGRSLSWLQVARVPVSQVGVNPFFEVGQSADARAFQGAHASGAFGAWVIPDARTGVLLTLVSLFVGLLYRTWPFLKTLPFFSILWRPRTDLLRHPIRRGIVDAVGESPGIHYSALMRQVGHGNHVVRHHVDRLLSANLLVERQGSRFSCYFPPGLADRRVLDVLPVLKGGQADALLRAVVAQPGQSGGELATVLGLSAGTVSYHAKRLQEAGLVRMRADGRTRRLDPSELARPALSALARLPSQEAS